MIRPTEPVSFTSHAAVDEIGDPDDFPALNFEIEVVKPQTSWLKRFQSRNRSIRDKVVKFFEAYNPVTVIWCVVTFLWSWSATKAHREFVWFNSILDNDTKLDKCALFAFGILASLGLIAAQPLIATFHILSTIKDWLGFIIFGSSDQ